jgi:hypothetical protein
MMWEINIALGFKRMMQHYGVDKTSIYRPVYFLWLTS